MHPRWRACARARRASDSRRWRQAALLGVALLGAVLVTSAPAAAAEPPAAARAAPDRDHYLLRRVDFEGHTSFSADQLAALAAPFLNRPVRWLDLEELRQRVTRAYVERGLVNSGALLPDDAPRDGVLRVRIVEGQVAQVQVRGAAGLADAYVGARLTRRAETLDVGVLQERFRLLLADPLFERVNVRLMPGAAPGQAVLDVDVVPAPRWQARLVANNHQAPAVGSRAVGAAATLRNLSGWGDALDLSATGGGHNEHYDLAWTLPLAASRTLAQLRLAHGVSSVIEEPLTVLDIGSTVDTRELSIGHPVLDDARRRLVLGLGWAERENRTTLAGEPFTFVAGEASGTTRVRAWRFYQDLTLRLDRHVLALRSTFVAGRNNLDASAPLPGQAPPHYRLWQGQAQALLPTGDGAAHWLLRAQVQRASDALVPLEQTSIGGRHTVRGYRENQLVRDSGHAVGVEYHHRLHGGETDRRRVALVPFVDAGAARDRAGPRARLASVGAGLLWAWDDFEGELFLARRLERRPIATHGDLQDRGIHFALRYRLH